MYMTVIKRRIAINDTLLNPLKYGALAGTLSVIPHCHKYIFCDVQNDIDQKILQTSTLHFVALCRFCFSIFYGARNHNRENHK